MKFQYILVTFFGAMAVFAVIAFSLADPKPKDEKLAGAAGNVVIWGSYPPEGGVSSVINDFNQTYQKSFTLSYEYHDPKKFDQDIVEALASGKGPDVLLLPDDLVLRHTDKIELISYTSFTPRLFQDTFIQASEIYMRKNGLIALPFAVDPIVMYWNRSLFDNALITAPPKYWDEFLVITPQLTKRDAKTQDIIQSAVAFGEYSNIEQAKSILALLFLQTGASIIRVTDDVPLPDLMNKVGVEFIPNQNIVSAFRFYMDFSNPLKNIFTWSRALPNSRDQFLSGKLAVYFDYASAYRTLKEKNPHLNFSVVPVPQGREASVKITAAKVSGLAVLKSSRNKQTAFIAVQKLLDSGPSGQFAKLFSLPPVRRDLLTVRQTDAVMSVLYESAIQARAWQDPRPSASDAAFRSAVESVSSGKNTVESAVDGLQSALGSALY